MPAIPPPLDASRAAATLVTTWRLPPQVEARADGNYRVVRANPEDHAFSPELLNTRANGADALLIGPTDRLTADVIGHLPSTVRIVATFSVGTDHIDLAAARARGLVVTNTPDVVTDATAEIAVLLLLGAARRAGEGQRMIRAACDTPEGWRGWTPTQLLGRQLTGKRLGIFGMGRIGQAVARRARAFDMIIHYTNRRRLPLEQEQGAIYHPDPDTLLACADFLSLHCPSTPETRHWLNAERISRLPERAVVINTARGAVVDDSALIAALRSGRLFAAGLDVFDGEPDLHPAYRTLPNVVALPHLGSATEETRNAMGFRCLDNLDAFLAGHQPPDRVV